MSRPSEVIPRNSLETAIYNLGRQKQARQTRELLAYDLRAKGVVLPTEETIKTDSIASDPSYIAELESRAERASKGDIPINKIQDEISWFYRVIHHHHIERAALEDEIREGQRRIETLLLILNEHRLL